MQSHHPTHIRRTGGTVMLAIGAIAILAPAAQGQLRSSGGAAKVTLVAEVVPRMAFEDVSPVQVREVPGYAESTRHLSVAANVPYTLTVRLPHNAPGAIGMVEVLDRGGKWVTLPRGAAVTLTESGPAKRSHTVQCRVAGPAPLAATDCPVSYELVSTHPQFPMRVTAMPGLLVAQRL